MKGNYPQSLIPISIQITPFIIITPVGGTAYISTAAVPQLALSLLNIMAQSYGMNYLVT